MAENQDQNQGRRRMVSLTDKQDAMVDEYRFKNRIRTDSEAIRQIIDAGLKALEVAGK